jgi:hypothetical protein
LTERPLTTNALKQTQKRERRTKKATVFPVPVLALARTSLPRNVNWSKCTIINKLKIYESNVNQIRKMILFFLSIID